MPTVISREYLRHVSYCQVNMCSKRRRKRLVNLLRKRLRTDLRYHIKYLNQTASMCRTQECSAQFVAQGRSMQSSFAQISLNQLELVNAAVFATLFALALVASATLGVFAMFVWNTVRVQSKLNILLLFMMVLFLCLRLSHLIMGMVGAGPGASISMIALNLVNRSAMLALFLALQVLLYTWSVTTLHSLLGDSKSCRIAMWIVRICGGCIVLGLLDFL
jgi:hypothetical protein